MVRQWFSITLCMFFSFYVLGQPLSNAGDIVINELLLDETPSVKLPEYEYIELYNTTEHSIVLTDWFLEAGKKIRRLPKATLEANTYLLLCSDAASKELSKYGKTIAILKFPALANKSGTISLKNKEGVLIDEISYQRTWYNDKKKDDGDWSLERIDPNVANSRANWTASIDDRGGTPCEKNSVFGMLIDENPPKIKSAIPINLHELVITFDEAIDTLAIQQNFFFVNGIGYPEDLRIAKDEMKITLYFKDKFIYGKTYELRVKEVLDVFGNVLENVLVLFSLPELVEKSELIINEILFNPPTACAEYVELYNRSKKVFDLSTISIAKRDSENKLRGVYVLSEHPRLLSPNEFVVLTTKTKLVEENYIVKNPNAMLEMKKMPSFPNEKGIVVILNQQFEIVDELHYNEKMHLPILIKKKGVALERMHYDLPTQNPSNWHSASEASGFGTPTSENSTYRVDSAENHIKIIPKVFSPNGDGIDDFMQIQYEFSDPDNIAKISVFDSNGRLVRNLHSNLTLDTKGAITWNGVNSSSERVRTGRYIIFIEIFDIEGNINQYKRSCVVHYRFK